MGFNLNKTRHQCQKENPLPFRFGEAFIVNQTVTPVLAHCCRCHVFSRCFEDRKLQLVSLVLMRRLEAVQRCKETGEKEGGGCERMIGLDAGG